MKHVLVLKLSKEMVDFFLHYMFNFFCPFHAKVIFMDNAKVMETNTSHTHSIIL